MSLAIALKATVQLNNVENFPTETKFVFAFDLHGR